MATYRKVPRSVPSHDRTTLITDVAIGDQIDLREILGRAARGLQLVTSSDTDEVEYRLNSLLRSKRVNESNTTMDYTWSVSAAFPVFSSVGSTIEMTGDLTISSIEIVDLTLGSGTTIQIVVW